MPWLDDELYQQVRDVLDFHAGVSTGWLPEYEKRLRKTIAALDAAAGAGEGFERQEDGNVVVRGSLQWLTELSLHHRIVPLIVLREVAPSETDNPDDTVLAARIEWTYEDAYNVGRALLAFVTTAARTDGQDG